MRQIQNDGGNLYYLDQGEVLVIPRHGLRAVNVQKGWEKGCSSCKDPHIVDGIGKVQRREGQVAGCVHALTLLRFIDGKYLCPKCRRKEG